MWRGAVVGSATCAVSAAPVDRDQREGDVRDRLNAIRHGTRTFMSGFTHSASWKGRTIRRHAHRSFAPTVFSATISSVCLTRRWNHENSGAQALGSSSPYKLPCAQSQRRSQAPPLSDFWSFFMLGLRPELR